LSQRNESRLTESHLRAAFALREFDGARGQLPMTPSTRGRPAPRAPGAPPRDGAALAYAFRDDRERLVFPLTLRRDDLPEHRGQVSLPGGRPRDAESLWAAAIREAAEEVGLRVPALERVGVLSAVEIPHTNSRLFVHVALGPDPRPLAPEEREVARIEWAALDDLVDPSCRGTTVRRIDGTEVPVPVLRLGGLEVWGATAMALSELAERLRAVSPATRSSARGDGAVSPRPPRGVFPG
jgi:8-oxo-dGTP pyrophosphatase MutT (NUDIX family)